MHINNCITAGIRAVTTTRHSSDRKPCNNIRVLEALLLQFILYLPSILMQILYKAELGLDPSFGLSGQ